MLIFESVLALLMAATLLSALARRVSIPYPTLLAVAGALVAFVPDAPRLNVPAELILALFVAPVLLDAAYDTSLRDLKRNWAPVSSLVLVAVALSTIAVAVAARHFIPEIPWAAADGAGTRRRFLPSRQPSYACAARDCVFVGSSHGMLVQHGRDLRCVPCQAGALSN